MAKIDELHNYAYPDKYLDELHIYDKSIGNNGIDEVHNYGDRGVTYGMDELHLYGSYNTLVDTSIDELNAPTEREEIDIDEYFDEIDDMDEGQKELRKEIARDFKDILKLLLTLILSDLTVGNDVNVEFYQTLFKSRLMDVVDTKLPNLNATLYVEIENYIDKDLFLVIDSTLRHQEDAYYFSDVRATAIAVDDAMATVNLEELDRAIRDGYKYKVWVTMNDSKVRHSHVLADQQRVEIDKPFTVGRCKMQAPRVFDKGSDYEDAKEIVNCRCHLVYSNKGE